MVYTRIYPCCMNNTYIKVRIQFFHIIMGAIIGDLRFFRGSNGDCDASRALAPHLSYRIRWTTGTLVISTIHGRISVAT